MPPKVSSSAARVTAAVAKEPSLHLEPTNTIVAFSSVEFLCWEYDDEVTLKIVRRGTHASHACMRCPMHACIHARTHATHTGAQATRVKVYYKTHNESLPETSYLFQEGSVTLEKDMLEVTFPIKIINNPYWDVEGMLSHAHLAYRNVYAYFAHARRAQSDALRDSCFMPTRCALHSRHSPYTCRADES